MLLNEQDFHLRRDLDSLELVLDPLAEISEPGELADPKELR